MMSRTTAPDRSANGVPKRIPGFVIFVMVPNIGAAANDNLTFDLARGEYFKWVAQDDVSSKDFLKRSVEVLVRTQLSSFAIRKKSRLIRTGR
jgi:hypothetical protein